MNLSPNKNGEVGETQLNRFKELGKNISDTFKTDLTKASGVTATADSTWKNSDKYGAAKVLRKNRKVSAEEEIPFRREKFTTILTGHRQKERPQEVWKSTLAV